MKRFPIIGDGKYVPRRGYAVPFSLVETVAAQLSKNHDGQSVQRLADRGGLSPKELWSAFNARGVDDDMDDERTWVNLSALVLSEFPEWKFQQ